MTFQSVLPVLVLAAAWIPVRRALEVSDVSAAEFTAAAAPAAARQPSVECPLAKYNTHTNRYEVQPVSQRIRAELELRESVSGHAACSGPLVTQPDDLFSFEAVHFHPSSGVWQGVLAAPPVLEKASLDQVGKVFDACVALSNICVARLEPPPPSNWLARMGFWVPRERSPKVQNCLNWLGGVIAIYFVAFVIIMFAVPRILQGLGLPDEEVEEEDPESTLSRSESQRRLQRQASRNFRQTDGIPSSYQVIIQAVSSLGRFAASVLTLILVCCYFIFQREVVDVYARILNYGPVVLMVLHLIVLCRSTSKTLLYNAMLRSRLHMIFDERKYAPLYREPVFVSACIVAAIMLFAGFMTIAADAKQLQCESEAVDEAGSGSCLSLTQVALQVGVSLWGLIFPVGYCMYLIYADENFEILLVPLYTIYEVNDKASGDLGDTLSIKYTAFVAEAQKKCEEEGVDKVTFGWAHEFATQGSTLNESHADTDRLWRQAWKGIFSTWSWRLRLRHSIHRCLELRIVLALGLAAICWSVLLAFLAELFRNTLIPHLAEITPSLGQLSPEFNPYVFNYNLFVDHHVKSGSLEIIADKNSVSDVGMNLQGEQAEAPWTEATKNVHVPFFVRSVFTGRDDPQAEVLNDSRNAPVPIHVHVSGAGTTFVYSITVVKLETRISSLEYRYNTSSTVHEVVVKKKIDWDKLTQAEEVDEESKEFADPDIQGAAVYVPIDTETVLVKMERNLAIYGPAGNTVLSNMEVDEFAAARKLVLCPPTAGSCQKRSGASRVQIQDDVTALPVELRPNGTDPFRFIVNIIRVANRLINLDLEAPMRKAVGGSGWGEMPLLPAFRPLVDSYETFFEVADNHGGEEEQDAEQTLFLRVRPQGNARTNWVQAELLPNINSGTQLELFCRPVEADDGDELLDPLVAPETDDLACGATSEQAHDPEDGKPTEDLVIRDKKTGRAFKEHFFIRYKYKPSEPAPFTLLLQVSFLEHAMEGAVANINHRTYEVKFLPQAPMRLELFGPSQLAPALETPAGNLLQATGEGARGTSQSRAPLSLPLFLSPAFRSDILRYTAVVPRNAAASVQVRLEQSHSLWASGGGGPLRGLGQGAELRQEVKLQRGPGCVGDNLAPAAPLSFPPAPAPMPASAAGPTSLQTGSDICAVQIRIYERREGFPRTYTVHLREAQIDQVLFMGMLRNSNRSSDITAPEALPGFQPAARDINSSLKDLEWTWGSPAPGPAPPATAPAPALAPASAAGAQAAEEPALLPLAFSAAAAAVKAMARDPALATTPHRLNLIQMLGQADLETEVGPWTGEPLPSGLIGILAASDTAYLSAEWNGHRLATARADGLWWHTTLAGKALVESCWCDREQLLNNCLSRLRAKAPSAVAQFYRPNACRLTLKTNDKAAYVIRVGHAWDVVDGALLDQAADAADKLDGQAETIKERRAGRKSSLLQNPARRARRSSADKKLSAFSSSVDELLLPQSLTADELLIPPSFAV